MTSIAILGATGSLGSLVARQAAAAGNSVSLLVRSPGKLPLGVAARAQVVTADLITTPPAALAQFAEGHDVLVCCAGLVTEVCIWRLSRALARVERRHGRYPATAR